MLRTTEQVAPESIRSQPISPEPISRDPPVHHRHPVLQQHWGELAYFHWPYEPEVVQRCLPQGVTVDLFEGSAWVGLIPFEMRKVQLGPTPPLPWLGSFIEINVRTYVTDALGRRAVWFFSLDVPRAVIVAVARSAFALPYCWAKAGHERHGDRHRYQTTRRWPLADAGRSADMAFTVAQPIDAAEVGDLEHFLTARWALLTQRRTPLLQPNLLYGEVRHARWPLHRVENVQIDQNLIEAAGLPGPTGPPHSLYSPGVDVQVAWFQKVAGEEPT